MHESVSITIHAVTMASFPIFQVTEGEWKSVPCVDVLGLRIPAHMTPDPQLLCDFILNFQTRPDDVFVVGFPKSGERHVELSS